MIDNSDISFCDINFQYYQINDLLAKADRRYVICGTGKLAQNAHQEFDLLELDFDPFLYGDIDDEMNGFRTLNKLRDIEDPKNCRFVFLNEQDEWFKNSDAAVIANETIGALQQNQDNNTGIRLVANELSWSRVKCQLTDMFSTFVKTANDSETFSQQGLDSPNSFKIHLYGASQLMDITSYCAKGFGGVLYETLLSVGLNGSIHNYAMRAKSPADNICRLISNIESDNLLPFFIDESHFSVEGCEVLSKRVAAEIVSNFPQFMHGGESIET